MYEPLTDDVHLAEVQADFGEGGNASSSVVSPTVTILSSGVIRWTLGGVVEPGKNTHTHTNTRYLSSTLHLHYWNFFIYRENTLHTVIWIL